MRRANDACLVAMKWRGGCCRCEESAVHGIGNGWAKNCTAQHQSNRINQNSRKRMRSSAWFNFAPKIGVA